jgi:hypothetical protein
MVCRGDLSDITGPLHHGGLAGPDSPTLPHDAELIGSSRDDDVRGHLGAPTPLGVHHQTSWEPRLAGVGAAAAWFIGDNDAGEPMCDPDTGGGYDGLHADGVNSNQGAESTLAVISTLQHAQRLSILRQ